MAVGFFSSCDDLSDIINSVHEPITTDKFPSFPSNETDTIFPPSLFTLFFLYLLFSTSSFSEKFPLQFLYFFPSLSLVYSVCIHFLSLSLSSLHTHHLLMMITRRRKNVYLSFPSTSNGRRRRKDIKLIQGRFLFPPPHPPFIFCSLSLISFSFNSVTA